MCPGSTVQDDSISREVSLKRLLAFLCWVLFKVWENIFYFGVTSNPMRHLCVTH